MNTALKTIFTLIGVALLLFFLFYIRAIVIYFIISVVIAFLGRPLVSWLSTFKIKGKHIPSSLRAFLVLFLLFSIFFGLLRIFAPLVIEEAKLISHVDSSSIIESMNEPLEDLEQWMVKFDISPEAGNQPKEVINSSIKTLIGSMNISKIFRGSISFLGNIFVALFSITFISFFLLKDSYLIHSIILGLTPDKHLEQMKNVVKNTKELMGRYFIGLTIQVCIISILVGVGLSILGIKQAILIGIFAGLINIIPYVGPLLAGAVGIMYTFISNIDLNFYNELIPLGIKVLCVFGIVQLLDNLFFQPYIFSNSVKAHPLEIFLVVLIAGTIGGVPGMIIAIPTYSIIRIIAKEYLSEFKIIRSLTKKLDN